METTATVAPNTKNKRLLTWGEEIAALTEPAAIHWCDGSAEEYNHLCQLLVDAGTFSKLSEAMLLDLIQGPFKQTAFSLHRTDPVTGKRERIDMAAHLQANVAN